MEGQLPGSQDVWDVSVFCGQSHAVQQSENAVAESSKHLFSL